MTEAGSKTEVVLGTATPGGGFPLFGNAAAEAINETDPTLSITPRNTKGSAENIGLLENDGLDIALVAGEPAYEAFAGIGRPVTNIKIIGAIYSSPGMIAVRGDSSVRSLLDLVGKPVAWGTRASGITLLGRYVADGLGLDREKDFQAVYLEQAGDGPLMVEDGRVAALWGAGIGWPGFTAVLKSGGRLLGFAEEQIDRICAKHSFLKPIDVPAGAYPGQQLLIHSVGSWSYICARASLDENLSYGIARALHQAQPALVRRLDQGAETLPKNTFRAAPSVENIHPGVQRYLREIGVMP